MPFKIYPDFDCTVKRVKDSDRKNNASYPEKDEDHVPCCFSYKFVCIHDKFNKPIVRYRGKNAIYKSFMQFLKSIIITKKWWMNILIKILSCLWKMKKDFNQVIMLDM